MNTPKVLSVELGKRLLNVRMRMKSQMDGVPSRHSECKCRARTINLSSIQGTDFKGLTGHFGQKSTRASEFM
jgi:hypothetical protein